MKKVLFLAVSAVLFSSCSYCACPAYAGAPEKDKEVKYLGDQQLINS